MNTEITVEQPEVNSLFVENKKEPLPQRGLCCSFFYGRRWKQCPPQSGVFFSCASIIFTAAQGYPLTSLAFQGGSLLCHLFSSKVISGQDFGRSLVENVQKLSKENKKFEQNKKGLIESVQQLESAINRYEDKVLEAKQNKEAILLRMEDNRFEQQKLLQELTEAIKEVEIFSGVLESLKEQHRDALFTINRLESQNRLFFKQLEELGLLTNRVNDSVLEVEEQLEKIAIQSRRHKGLNKQLEELILTLQEQNTQIEYFFSLYQERMERFSLVLVNLDHVDDLFAKGAKELRQIKQKELRELHLEVYKLNRCIDLLASELSELRGEASERVQMELDRIVEQLQEYVANLNEYQKSVARIKRQASVAHIAL